MHGWQKLFPELEGQTCSWILPAPIARGEVSSDQCPGFLAKVRQLRSRLPTRRETRELVPVTAQTFQDLDVKINDRLAFPESLGIIGPRTNQMLLGTQVDP